MFMIMCNSDELWNIVLGLLSETKVAVEMKYTRRYDTKYMIVRPADDAHNLPATRLYVNLFSHFSNNWTTLRDFCPMCSDASEGGPPPTYCQHVVYVHPNSD
jgi:hypothetical protein